MEALYRHILEHQSTAVVLLDAALRVTYMNQSAEFLLAASNERSQGDHLCMLLRGDDDFERELEVALSKEQSFTRRITSLKALQAGSREIVVDYTVTPMTDCEQGGLLLELQPLDRLLRINREAAQLTLHRTTRHLVRGLAHEIKNPLGGIRGAAQLLARELDRPQLSDYTDVIIEEADRLRNLVDRMLGPNQLPHFRMANLHRILERVRQLITAEHPGRLRIERDYDPSIPDLYCDPDQILQAVLNVVRNAAQALEDTEDAMITLRSRTLRQITIGSERHRLVVRVDVLDNGPGIPADMLERLFYPMISGRADGTGLGLSITQAIISQHGGLIECESEPGSTCFTFLLPLESQDEAA
ncbi:MAG: nitrogen regulation protein NR(II) [Gammaproteobacteria bacterium]|nr:MAG: nitrogen regulation protein NR(II) [Gammaproteobacteria bacterium]